MEYYNEYPIRCKSCNEQLSCYSTDFEAYLDAGNSIEEALNYLNIMNPCSRIAMANPTIVSFNMENREVIEGFKSVDAADESEAHNESTSQPVFSSCLGNTAPIQSVKPVINFLPSNLSPTISPTQPQPLVRPLKTGIQTISLMKASPNSPGPVIPQIIPTTVQPIIHGIEFNNETPIGVGIPVSIQEPKKFEEPTLVGIPIINHDPTIAQPTIFVGHDKFVRVLNGRTYLAR